MVLAGVRLPEKPEDIVSEPSEMNRMLRDEWAKTFAKPFTAFPLAQAKAFLHIYAVPLPATIEIPR